MLELRNDLGMRRPERFRALQAAAIASLFGGHMTQLQVGGINAILDAWEACVPVNQDLASNLRWLAYELATTFHETARTMQPVREIGLGKGRDYGVPDPIAELVSYGRGYVQLTWKANYQVMGAALGIDLEHDPDLALQSDIAAQVLLHGMSAGSFTGRRLGQYFGAIRAHDDPVNARRIINGLDCAAQIAGYHRTFAAALAA